MSKNQVSEDKNLQKNADDVIPICDKVDATEIKENSSLASPQVLAKENDELSDDELIDFGPKVAKVKRSHITVRDIENLIVKCSACGKQVNHNDLSQIKKHLHLGVLICKECFHFYGDGVFSEDDSGYNYCRWCAKGGKLYGCDFCPNQFCMGCLRRNFARGVVHEIKEVKWKCYVCDALPIKGKVKFCDMIFKYCKNLKKEKKNKRSKLPQTELSQMSSDSEAEESTVVPSQWLPFHICRIIHLSEKLDKRLIKLKRKHELSDKSTKQIVLKIEELVTNHSKKINGILKTINIKYGQYVQWKKKSSYAEDEVVYVKSVLSSEAKCANAEILSKNVMVEGAEKTGPLNTPIVNGTDESQKNNSVDNPVNNLQTVDKCDIDVKSSEAISDNLIVEENLNQSELCESINASFPNKASSPELDKNCSLTSLKEPIHSVSPTVEVTDHGSNVESNSKDLAEEHDEAVEPNEMETCRDGDTEQSESLLSVSNNLLLSSHLLKLVNDSSCAEDGNSCEKQLTDVEKNFNDQQDKDKNENKSVDIFNSSFIEGNECEEQPLDIPNTDFPVENDREGLSKNEAAKKMLLKESSSDSDNSDKNVSMPSNISPDLKNFSENSFQQSQPLKKLNTTRTVARKSFFGKTKTHKLKENMLKAEISKSSEKKKDKNSAKEDNSDSSSISVSSYLSSDADDSPREKKNRKVKKGSLPSLCLKQENDTEEINMDKNSRDSDPIKSSEILLNDPKLKVEPHVIIENLLLSPAIDEAGPMEDKDGMKSDSDSLKNSLDICAEVKNMIKSTERLLKRKIKSHSTNESSEDSQVVTHNSSIKEKGKPEKKKKKKIVMDSASEPFTLSSSPEELADEINTDTTLGSLLKIPDKNQLAKETLLNDTNVSDDSSSDLEDESSKQKPKKAKTKDISEKESEEKSEKNETSESASSNKNSDDDFEVPRKKLKRHRLLAMPHSDDDSQSSKSKKQSQKNEKKKKSFKRKIFSSDESNAKNNENSDSEESSDTSDTKSKSKSKGTGAKKRRRIKELSNSSDASKKVDNDDSDNPDTPGKGRKNIRKIISDKKLTDETKEAAQAEKERRRRVALRQKLYNEITDVDPEHGLTVTRKMVLEVNEESKEEVVEIHPDIVEKLKPHQISGVRFMWECTIESLKQLEANSGSGCILAHCMGLGKTLQVIAFLYTLFTNRFVKKKLRTAMIICPYNTVLNWAKEFEIWLKDAEEEINVFEMTNAKNSYQRKDVLQQWQDEGGVLILSYNIFRRLAEGLLPKASKKLKESVRSLIVDPGADVVVCDEGHILKNETSAVSKATSKLKTQRRIVLTGTPLQNNLKEYHCMVHFVKPHLLGTRKEFLNRFVNPIINGQCADSSQHDVKIMKKRVHILHKLLEGCVQRCDYSALTKFLPDKHEFVISVKLSENQIKMYRHFLDYRAQGRIICDKVEGRHLFTDYSALKSIWTHPYLCKLSYIRDQNKRMIEDSDSDSMSSFINDDTSNDELEGNEVVCLDEQPGTSKEKKDSSGDEIIKTYRTRSRRKAAGEESEDDVIPEVPEKHWWDEFFSEEDKYKLEISGKMVLVFQILRECELIGDKILIFSQSLLTLDMLEELLALEDEKNEKIHSGEQSSENIEEQATQDILGSWVPGIDYFRMDGATSVELRKRWIDVFNDKENDRARLFLISTKAGSLGTNLIGANRVILLDASWNPSHDVQAIFRVYRFGQVKPVYIYRLLAQGTMEEKIYDRQVTKLSLSCRVVDEQNVERHFNAADLQALYSFEPESQSNRPTPMVPKDRLMAEMLIKYKEWIVTYHEHDSLLQNVIGDDLTEEERRTAWQEYENEKEGLINENFMGTGDIFSNFTGASSTFSASESSSIDVEGHIKAVIEKTKAMNPKADNAYLLSKAILDLSNLQRYYGELHKRGLNDKIKLMQKGAQIPAEMLAREENLQAAIIRVRDCVTQMKQQQYYHFTMTKTQQQQRQQEQQRQKAQQQAASFTYSRQFTGNINAANSYAQNATIFNNAAWRNPNPLLVNQLRSQGITVTQTSSAPGASTYNVNRMPSNSAYYPRVIRPRPPQWNYKNTTQNSKTPQSIPIITEIDESEQNVQTSSRRQNQPSTRATSVTITEVD